MDLPTLLKAGRQELFGTVCPLLLLLLDFPEEVGQILVTSGVVGVPLVVLRSLEGMVKNTDEIVGWIARAGIVGHEKASFDDKDHGKTVRSSLSSQLFPKSSSEIERR